MSFFEEIATDSGFFNRSLRSFCFGRNLLFRCEKTDFGESVFRKTYDLAVGKSFHDSSYHVSTSSLPALCLDQDVLDRTTRISHRPREVRKVAGKGTNQN